MTPIWILVGLLAQQPAPAPASLDEWNNRGQTAIKKNDLKGAEDIFRSALELAKSAGDRGWEAEFDRAIGETYQRRNQWREALPFYEASLAIRRERQDRPEIAYQLTGIGYVHLSLGEYDEAERYLEQGRAAYAALNDQAHVAQAVQLMGQLKARKRFDQANAYLRASEYGPALQAAFEVLEMQRAANAVQAAPLEMLGKVFLATEQAEKALGYFEECLAIRLRAKDPAAISTAYNNIGLTLETMGRSKEALEVLGKALDLRKSAGVPADVAQTLINIGNAQESLGMHAEAATSFEQAQKLAEESRSQGNLGLALYGLGQVALSTGKLDEAIALHTRAMKIRQDSGDRIGVVHSLNRLALASEMKGNLAQAEKLHANALEEFEKIAAGIRDPEQVGRFRQNTIVLYPHYARVLLKEGKTEAAFGIAERSRGAGLARMAELSRQGFLASLSDADRASWNAAAAGRARATNRLRDALRSQTPAPAVAQARSAYNQADNALAQLRDRIFAGHPELATAKAAPLEVARMLAASRAEPSTVYMEWLTVDPSSTLLFVLAGGAVRGFELADSTDSLAKMSANWRATFARGNSRGVKTATQPAQGDPAAEAQAARRLYSATFGPVAPEIAKHAWTRMVLVPDGPMLGVPFAALEDEKGARLIENYPVTTATSVASLMERVPRKPAAMGLLAVGDPLAPGEERVVAPSGDRYGPLEHARAEARSAADAFPDSRVLIGEEAREALVKQEIGKYRIVHFATHGILSRDSGLDSGLLLANEAADSSEDGVLQAWEIADTPLAAGLAVLSACDTAQGDAELGEGLVGLAWAFQAAGCPNVIASLWNIDDEATGKLIREFYKSVKAGARLDVALRNAMIAVKAMPGTESPYYWAGFRMIGPGGESQ
jgi:CHAT domain-containing protein/tetratricopeptide (TPR) repeat protein